MNAFHTFGIILAVVIHGAIGGSAWVAYELADQRKYPCTEDSRPADVNPADDFTCLAVGKLYRVVEATLARLREKDTKQPQKRFARNKKRSGKRRAINRSNPNSQKRDKKRDDDVTEDDIKKQLAKIRGKDDEEDDEDDLEPGKPSPKTRGQFHGHKHGFADVSKGDPYLQKLAADVYNSWNVPTLETGKGMTVGCIRLEPDGSVKDTKLRAGQKTGNQRFDASVTIALEKLQKLRAKKNHKKEVPTHLMEVTTRWLCFRFKKKTD